MGNAVSGKADAIRQVIRNTLGRGYNIPKNAHFRVKDNGDIVVTAFHKGGANDGCNGLLTYKLVIAAKDAKVRSFKQIRKRFGERAWGSGFWSNNKTECLSHPIIRNGSSQVNFLAQPSGAKMRQLGMQLLIKGLISADAAATIATGSAYAL